MNTTPAGVKEQTKRRRITELDSLRGIAALWVMLYHYTVQYPGREGATVPSHWLVDIGYLGVHVFFIISGFVIYLTLERKKDILAFCVTRFSRLYPVFWASMLVTLLSLHFLPLPWVEIEPAHALANVTMLQVFFNMQSIDGVYWTLAFELAFYFWAAVLFYTRLERHRQLLFPLIIAWILFWKIWENDLGLVIPYRVHAFVLVRYLHLFLLGVVLYRVYSGMPLGRASPYILCCLLIAFQSSFAQLVTVSLVVAYFLLTFAGKIPFMANRVFVFFGLISYALYLIHNHVGHGVLLYLPFESYYVRATAASLVSILVAAALTFTVERPAQRWLTGFFKKHMGRLNFWKKRGISPYEEKTS